MFRTISIKEFTYKGKKYKFIDPLKAKFESSLAGDNKTMVYEMYIEKIPDGFTRREPFDEDLTKELKNHIKKVFDDYLTKPDEQLSNKDDVLYKHIWISLFKEPKKWFFKL